MEIEVENMAENQTDETPESKDLETGEEQEEAPGEAQETENDKGEMIVTIGEEEPPSSDEEHPAPAWVKELRKSHQEISKENRNLRSELESLKKPKDDQQLVLGPKPTYESSGYDDEKFEKAISEYYDRKRKIDERNYQIQRQTEQQQNEWNQKINDYNNSKKKLTFNDVEEAEATVQSFMNIMQQGLIIQGADDPALLVYALGKNPKKAQELANIKDPIKFAFQVAKIESKLSMKPRKVATKPEKIISGSAPISGSLNTSIEKLRAEAERTGDYTKLNAYNREKRRSV